MVQDCTDTTQTICHPCGRGEFLETWNNEKYCHPHKYCDPSAWAAGEGELGS